MAETKRMTAEQVVSYLLEGGGPRFSAPVTRVGCVQQLMEVEVSELVGAGRGGGHPRSG